jgi:hypothetical protein
MVKNLGLKDVWSTSNHRTGFTCYGTRTASRIDRIYDTKNLYEQKTAVETMATAFSEHHAVILRLPIETPFPLRGRSYWKMNISYLNENNWMEEFQTHWTHWQKHKRRYVKTMLNKHFMNTGTNRRRDRQKLENFC